MPNVAAGGTAVAVNPEIIHRLLLSAETATYGGTWVDIGTYRKDGAIHVDGFNGDTVVIDGSSASTKPADSDNGDVYIDSTVITGDGHYKAPNPPRWIKARLTRVSGTVTVAYLGSR